MCQAGTEKITKMITSITILTTTLIIALALIAVSAMLQVIGYNTNITTPDTDDMLSKLSHALNTFAMMIFLIGFLSVVVG